VSCIGGRYRHEEHTLHPLFIPTRDMFDVQDHVLSFPYPLLRAAILQQCPRLLQGSGIKPLAASAIDFGE
jgi:hypothetical protein